jgi:hypothetical protein
MPPTPSQQKAGLQQQAGPHPAAGDYRYMSTTRAMELPIGDGLPWLEPGEIVTLASTDMNPKALQLIEDGILVNVADIVADPESVQQATTASSEEKGGK